MSEVHVITIDVDCSCGDALKGAWSADEVETWLEAHEEEHSSEG